MSVLLDLLYPPKCPFCGRVLERGEDGMCALCQAELPWTEADDARSVDGCETCLSPLWYRNGVPEGIYRYKFGGEQNYARLFGTLMAQCLADRCRRPIDLITWAPLSAKRLRQRGYDQAELLARQVGELSRLTVTSTLVKVKQTETQSDLEDDGARKANVSGVYQIRPGVNLTGKRVALVDDIVTSGSTLAECASRLREAGADAVVGLTFARAR